MSRPWALNELQRTEDAVLFLLRAVVGAFLIYGVWDNIVDSARMEEFVSFLRQHGFPAPSFLARLSVWAQFFIGLAFLTGCLTRWAGILCAINFLVAIVMVDRFQGIRGAFPSACLLCIGLYLAARGAGRYSLDRFFEASARHSPTRAQSQTLS